MKKVSMDGALARMKASRALVNQIAEMELSPGNQISELDKLILRAREINTTAAKGEIL